MSKPRLYPTNAQVELYDHMVPLLVSFLTEMRDLTKKKDVEMNKVKVRMINKVLAQLKVVLQNEPASEFLDLLDEDSLPMNSDALLILGQYDAALKTFRRAFWHQDGRSSRWYTQENLPPGYKK